MTIVINIHPRGVEVQEAGEVAHCGRAGRGPDLAGGARARQVPHPLVCHTGVGEVEAGEAGQPPADGEAELVSRHVAHVQPLEAGEAGQRLLQGAAEVSTAGDLRVLGQTEPQPLAETETLKKT